MLLCTLPPLLQWGTDETLLPALAALGAAARGAAVAAAAVFCSPAVVVGSATYVTGVRVRAAAASAGSGEVPFFVCPSAVS